MWRSVRWSIRWYLQLIIPGTLPGFLDILPAMHFPRGQLSQHLVLRSPPQFFSLRFTRIDTSEANLVHLLTDRVLRVIARLALSDRGHGEAELTRKGVGFNETCLLDCAGLWRLKYFDINYCFTFLLSETFDKMSTWYYLS